MTPSSADEPVVRPAAVVCGGVEAAEAARIGGADVVLVVAPGAASAVGAAGASCGAGAAGGRLAVFVGDPSDPADLRAAQLMADEVFGRRSVGPAGTEGAG